MNEAGLVSYSLRVKLKKKVTKCDFVSSILLAWSNLVVEKYDIPGYLINDVTNG